MKVEKLDILQIEWKRGSGLRKSDLNENGKNKCILYGELYTKHKSVLIESSEISRTNKDGKVHSKKGDILVPGTSTAAKKDMLLAREIDEDGVILGGDINIIRPEQGLFAKKYLPYYFETFTAYDQLDRYITGATGIIHISNKGLKNLKVPLPPLPEQQRIVSILDQAFTAIDKAKANAEQNLQNAKELFESYLQGVFEKKGDRWEDRKLGDVCVVERGSSPRPIKKYQTNSPDGVNWIKIGDTKGVEKYIYTTKEKITKEGAEKSRYVKEGDFILSNSMSFGKPYIMKTDGYIHDGWFVFRLPNYLDKDYFYYLLTSPNVQKQIQSLGSGAIVKNISGDLVKKVDVFYPKTIKEQQTIVRQLDDLRDETQKLEAVYQKKMDDLEELKKSILQKAFAGELKTEKVFAV